MQTTDTFKSTNTDVIRAQIMQKQNPIHNYLFDNSGGLLLANLNALNKWNLQGEVLHKELAWQVTAGAA